MILLLTYWNLNFIFLIGCFRNWILGSDLKLYNLLKDITLQKLQWTYGFWSQQER